MKKNRWLTISLSALVLCNIILLIVFIASLPISESKIYDSSFKKTVEIKCFNDSENIGYATGAIISENGEILTNKHVVKYDNENYFKNIQVRFYDELDFHDATVKKVSEADDLAVITVIKKTNNYFKLGNKASGGDRVFTIGNPNGFGLSFSGGNISSPQRIVQYNETQIKAIQTSIVINEGNSGGPLYNEKIELIGIISFRLKNKSGEIIHGVSFAIHINTIKDFI